MIGSLLMMRVAHDRPHPVGAKLTMVVQLKDGWGYVRSYVPVRNILLLFAVCSFMGMPYMTLLPVFATQGPAWRA